jgi:glutamate/tyrosine decarboxylase-like PLP-dependent enzyme
MPPSNQNTYQQLLERLKAFFPAPASCASNPSAGPIGDFLDRLANPQTGAPLLGQSVPLFGDTDRNMVFPEAIGSLTEVSSRLLDYCQGAARWSHPNCQAQVTPPPTLASLSAFLASAVCNANIVEDQYAPGFAAAERQAVAMLSALLGYDPAQSGGVFTFGGTGALLYGCKLGLERLYRGQAMRAGLREDVKIVASDTSHHARLNVAAWLGIGADHLVTIPSTRDNAMSLPHLEDYLHGAYSRGEKIAAIIATVGTTDAFGIDDIAAIAGLRDRLCTEYRVAQPPHLHADAVIGWVWAVFRDYDFQVSPLGFHPRTVAALRDSTRRIEGLRLADSIGIDFHKTGYTPGVSSLFLVKDRRQLELLSRSPAEMPYLDSFGDYRPGHYTLECSRAGSGPLAAVANALLLGKQGYRVLIGHAVEMAGVLRQRLAAYPFIRVLNDANHGPVTLLRVYPDDVDASIILERELTDPGYRERTEALNAYNRRLAQWTRERALGGEGVLLSYTGAYRRAEYPDGPPIAAIKSFIMSPWTDLNAVEAVCRELVEGRKFMLKHGL